MKLVLLGLLCVMTGALRAADAVSIATQQEAEERMKRLTATIEEFQTGQAALQKQVNMLASDLSKLREDAARPPTLELTITRQVAASPPHTNT